MSDPTTRARSDHYSYTVYADPAMADSFDRARFSGPVGEMLAATQADVLKAFAGLVQGRPVVDVGTGTGRAALVLADLGAHVTALDASAEMLRVAQARAEARGARPIHFEVGDAHHLAHADGAFDLAVSLRVLMHTPDWRLCVSELCRVAAARVIVDFPSRGSVAALESAARRLRRAAGANVEAYRVFTEAQIRREFGRHGFRITQTHRQFVLPITVHKKFGSRRFTERVEGALASVGLLALAGSPVTVLAER